MILAQLVALVAQTAAESAEGQGVTGDSGGLDDALELAAIRDHTVLEHVLIDIQNTTNATSLGEGLEEDAVGKIVGLDAETSHHIKGLRAAS